MSLDNKQSQEISVRVSQGKAVDKLNFTVQYSITWLTGEQIEPQLEEGQTGSFIYSSNRPTETFVIYIINRIFLEQLAQQYEKPIESLHIHENTRTDGHVICWPGKIDSIEDAKMVLTDWAGLVGALLVSDKQDINAFYNANNPKWVDDTIKGYEIDVTTY